MLRFIVLITGFFLSVSLFAQRGGHGGGMGHAGGVGHASGGMSRGGFGGGGGYRGGGLSGGYRGGYGGGYRGGYNRGFTGTRGYYGGRGFYSGYRGYYGYPGLYGFGLGLGFGYYSNWYPYDYGYSGYPANYNYGYGGDLGYYGQPSYSYPPVTVVNNTPAYVDRNVDRDTEREPYRDEPRERGDARRPNDREDYQPTLYLIALKDHNIRPALTYWVERGMLHYVTMEREMREVPLSSIDRELSERLNRERNMTFRVPAA